MKWIMVANSNDCLFYECDGHAKHIKFIQEINHPENKLQAHDIVSDKPGHYKSCSYGRGAFTPCSNPVEIATDNFAREIARRLDKGRNQHKFDELIICMPAHMEGLLAKHLSKYLKKSIKKIVQKNILNLCEKDRIMYLRKVI